mmetsp:Transcript_14627/g.29498  ORF Transcript_14627/g.29498 Transcript_14627/m.29498 type:complete len:120 (-) Transcript_14627:786-1145(-)
MSGTFFLSEGMKHTKGRGGGRQNRAEERERERDSNLVEEESTYAPPSIHPSTHCLSHLLVWDCPSTWTVLFLFCDVSEEKKKRSNKPVGSLVDQWMHRSICPFNSVALGDFLILWRLGS